MDAAAARVPGPTLEPTTSLLENLTQAEPLPSGEPRREPRPEITLSSYPIPQLQGDPGVRARREAGAAGESRAWEALAGGGAGGGPAPPSLTPPPPSSGRRAPAAELGARPAGQDALPGVGERGGGRAGGPGRPALPGGAALAPPGSGRGPGISGGKTSRKVAEGGGRGREGRGAR